MRIGVILMGHDRWYSAVLGRAPRYVQLTTLGEVRRVPGNGRRLDWRAPFETLTTGYDVGKACTHRGLAALLGTSSVLLYFGAPVRHFQTIVFLLGVKPFAFAQTSPLPFLVSIAMCGLASS